MKCSCLSALLVYATQRTANCVALAILIVSYQLVNDIRAHGGNASILQRYTADLNDTAPLQAHSAIQFWLDCESSYKRLSQLALECDWISWRWRLLPLKPMLNDYSRCVVI